MARWKRRGWRNRRRPVNSISDAGKESSSKIVSSKPWYVYVVQSLEIRPNGRPGFFYVGSTTDPVRRLKQHNGLIPGGGKYTSMHRPWKPAALYGTYANRSEAFRAEMALKHGKRGTARIDWSPADSKWCRGEGPNHPWVRTGALDALSPPISVGIVKSP